MTIDPATQDTRVSIATTVMYLPVWSDRDDESIVNSADQLPIKPYYQPVAVMQYLGERFVNTIEDAELRDLIDAVNQDEWRTWQPGEAWISDVYVEDSDTPAGGRYRLEVLVKCLRGGWGLKVPDVGYNYVSGSTLATFKASDGGRYIGKLDGSGGKAADDAALGILDFAVKREISFADSLTF